MKHKQQNKSAPPPESRGDMPKTNWRYLFGIYGDRPFTVRPSDPLTNLMPDDPDRIYRKSNRNDFDIDRE
jgi:hypothetical protein